VAGAHKVLDVASRPERTRSWTLACGWSSHQASSPAWTSLASSSRDASSFLGGGRGVDFDMATGRLDGHISISSCTLDFLPPPTFNLSELVGSFPTKDLSIEDMVLIPDCQTQGGGTPCRHRMF